MATPSNLLCLLWLIALAFSPIGVSLSRLASDVRCATAASALACATDYAALLLLLLPPLLLKLRQQRQQQHAARLNALLTRAKEILRGGVEIPVAYLQDELADTDQQGEVGGVGAAAAVAGLDESTRRNQLKQV
jgi:hypothetical protein